MQAQLAREAWGSMWPECEPLMHAHREEIDPESVARMAWEPRPDFYATLDSMGLFVGVTARVDARLVGYCLWTLGPSMESAGLLATQGPWFVTPDWRRGPLGLRLFAQALREVRAAGAVRAFPHHWASSPRGLDKYFERLGAKPLEVVYSLWLGDS